MFKHEVHKEPPEVKEEPRPLADPQCPTAVRPSASSPFILSVQYSQRSLPFGERNASNPFFPTYVPPDFVQTQPQVSFRQDQNYPSSSRYFKPSEYSTDSTPCSCGSDNGKKPYRCSTCDRKYYKEHSLERHIPQCTGPRPPKNPKYQKPHTLKCRQRQGFAYPHSPCPPKNPKDNAFFCGRCPSRSFATEKALGSHKKAVHGPKGSDPDPSDPTFKSFLCTRCQKSYATEAALYHHKQAVHGPKGYDPDPSQPTFKSFVCTRCQILFASKEALQSHKNEVHGPKGCNPFPSNPKKYKFDCTRCPKSFDTDLDLYRHVAVRVSKPKGRDASVEHETTETTSTINPNSFENVKPFSTEQPLLYCNSGNENEADKMPTDPAVKIENTETTVIPNIFCIHWDCFGKVLCTENELHCHMEEVHGPSGGDPATKIENIEVEIKYEYEENYCL